MSLTHRRPAHTPSSCPAAGTAQALRAAGVPCESVLKIQEGRPNPADLMKNGEISLVLMTST